jgi:hypothetical protein
VRISQFVICAEASRQGGAASTEPDSRPLWTARRPSRSNLRRREEVRNRAAEGNRQPGHGADGEIPSSGLDRPQVLWLHLGQFCQLILRQFRLFAQLRDSSAHVPNGLLGVRHEPQQAAVGPLETAQILYELLARRPRGSVPDA